MLTSEMSFCVCDESGELIDILTFRSFVTPEILLTKLIQRYNVPKNIFNEKEKKKRIQIRICVFLTNWLNKESKGIENGILEKINLFSENVGDIGKHIQESRDTIQQVKTLCKELSIAPSFRAGLLIN